MLAAGGVAAFLFVLPAAGAPVPASRAPVPPAALEYNSQRIHPNLLKTLLEGGGGGSYPILIEYARSSRLLDSLPPSSDRLEARSRVIAALQADRARAAGPILAEIHRAGVSSVRSFWISPVIRLEAGAGLIAQLSHRPDILQIRPDAPVALEGGPLEADPDLQIVRGTLNLPWNLEAIRVGMAAMALQLDGKGVVVANLDTGVDWTHPALQQKYRGYDPFGLADHTGNWHVSTGENYPEPGDGFGHGTHTMGTLVGEEPGGPRVGVAVGASWIAVKMIDDNGAFFESWAHDAFEWIMAPEGDPALAPDIVSSSWSTGFGGDTRFQADVQALRAGGILPVFSAGNSGPWIGTINSPADYPFSTAVGALDDVGWAASFSSRGPSTAPWSEVKPEIAAPGVDVLSSVPGGYTVADGTSMAAPHLAGTAALLLQADPSLSPDQLEQILTQTALPLGPAVPNNQTGWGQLDAFAAALQVSPHGVLSGTVSIPEGPPVPAASVRAVTQEDGHFLTIAGDENGRYTLAALPGTYSLTARAFGYAPLSVQNLEVLTDQATLQDFDLLPLPRGWLSGTVRELESGQPLTAAIDMLNGPLSTRSGSDGRFSLSLPEGSWQVRLMAPAHRILDITVTVTAGMTTTVQADLPSAPHILLVDSGRWYYSSKVMYFREALDTLAYPYDVWDLRDPFGTISGISDSPVITDLVPYDLVIWSAPADSPGMAWVDDEIGEYLAQGGWLLVSGQNVAFWDAGGSLFVLPSYFPKYLGASYEHLPAPGSVQGLAGTPFEGLTLDLNTPDSGQEQSNPDSVSIFDPLLAAPAFVWPEGAPAGTLAGGCHPYRAAWTGFGLEGVGPRSERIEAFQRFLDWFVVPPPDYALHVDPVSEVLVGAPEDFIAQPIRIENTGVQSDSYRISVQPGNWPAWLEGPGGISTSSFLTLTVPGCSGSVVTATVGVPANLPRDTYDNLGLAFRSLAEPDLRSSLTLTMKTPAPLLLVEDGRWQFYGWRYADALDSRGLSYDLVDRSVQEATPDDFLGRYPLVIWTTGQDWFLPLPAGEQQAMIDFLDQGGGLLLTSQDLLNVAGKGSLARDYLGVAAYSTEITPTAVSAVEGGILDPALVPWPLNYPFVNWSDSFWPEGGAQPVIRDAGNRILGAANTGPNWRSLFFSFPLETLPENSLDQVLVDSLRWLGPLGGTKLVSPETAASSVPFPLQLVLRSAHAEPLYGVTISLPLPEAVAVVPGSIYGPWAYSQETHALSWRGALGPGQAIHMGLLLDASIRFAGPQPLVFPVTFRLADSQVFLDEAVVWLDAPDIHLFGVVAPQYLAPPAIGFSAGPIQTATFTLTAQNRGWTTAAVRLTDTLPVGLQLVTSTLSATVGSVSVISDSIHWAGSLEPEGRADIHFQGRVEFPLPMGDLSSWLAAHDGYRGYADWIILKVFGGLYFPFLNGPG